MFYRWRACDFVEIPAYELKRGDEIAYGNGPGLEEYGAIPLDDVTIVWGECVLLQFSLPVGAYAHSSQNVEIFVRWRGKEPLIRVSQDVAFSDCILIRRK